MKGDKIRKHFDFGTLFIIVVTLILFILALFTKGFTHDLLLEAGVFLVSVKLILLSYKGGAAIDSIEKKLDSIENILKQNKTEKKELNP